MEDKTEKPLGEEGIEGESREKDGGEKEFLAQGKDAMASYIADTADWPWGKKGRGKKGKGKGKQNG